MRILKGWTRAVLIATFVIGAAPRAEADAIGAVSFSAGSQSFWGPGKSQANLNKGGSAGVSILGVDVGVGFKVDASSGTVSGSYGGNLSLLGGSSHDLASGFFALGSAFDANAGSLATKFGASIDIYAYAEGIGSFSFPGFPKGNNLNVSGSINKEIGTQATVSGSTNFDLNAFDIWIVSAGATLKVTQASKFKATGISGKLTATHVGSGTTVQQNYTIGSAIDLDLGLVGDWVLSLSDLKLANSYQTGFDGAIGGFVDAFGDRHEITTTNFNLFDTASFSLAFGTSAWGGSMTVSVYDSSLAGSQPVPEPGTWVLLGAAGAFVAFRRRRR